MANPMAIFQKVFMTKRFNRYKLAAAYLINKEQCSCQYDGHWQDPEGQRE
jgi:hypothetical protein